MIGSCGVKESILNIRIGKVYFILLVFLVSTPSYSKAFEKLEECRSKLGVNVEGINYYSAGTPYVDLAKMSMGWIRPWGSKWEDVPLDLDEKGNLKSVDEGGAQTIIHDDNWGRSSTDDRYVLLYDGEGELVFNLIRPKVIKKTPGRIEVKLSEGRLGMAQTSTNKNNYLRNIRFIPKNLENNYQEKIVKNLFIEQWKGIGVIRYMNLQDINHSSEVSWQDRKKPKAFGTKGGSSIEDIIQMANETNTDPWLVAPHLGNDDYFKQMALYVRDNLRPNLKVYIEYTNEGWNSGFPQAKYLLKLAQKNKTSNHLEYGKRALELFKIWESVFGDKKRLVRVISTQFVNTWATKKIFETPGLTGHVDALAVGYYFGHELGSLEMVAQTMKKTDAEIFEYLKNVSLPETKVILAQQKAIANQHNIDLIAYEAGQHLVAVGGKHPEFGILFENEELTNKLIRINRDARMKDLYLAFYDNWVSAGGGLIAWFETTGKPDKWGMWGMLEFMGQSVKDAPKYQAIQQIIKNDRCH